jgi:Protein of unknown function (DUF1045)
MDGVTLVSVLAGLVTIIGGILGLLRYLQLRRRDDRGRRIYPNVNDPRFVKEIELLLLRAKSVTIIAPAAFIVQGNIHDIILRRAQARELSITLCFGNPFSQHLLDRLVEEERSSSKPDIGLDGIIRRIDNLLNETKHIDNVQIRLFNNYPTMCIMRFDDRCAYYPLGYRTLGNRCPVILEDGNSIMGQFLQSMVNRHLEDSVSAAEVFRTRIYKIQDRHFLTPATIRAVSIHAIPDPSSTFYHIGSQLLGLDPLGVVEIENPPHPDTLFFRSHFGMVETTGFCLPITDVMYFDVRQIPSLSSEVRYIASSIGPLQLKIDGPSFGTLRPNDFVLICSDESGDLETLQAEVTVRIRPTALGTDYTLDKDTRDQLSGLDARARHMLDAYQSPYVLSQYRPCFRLALLQGNLSIQDRSRLQRIIETRFRDYLRPEVRVMVNRLYIRQKPVSAQQWDPIDSDQIIRVEQ